MARHESKDSARRDAEEPLMKPKRCQRLRNTIRFKEEEPSHHFRPPEGGRIAEVM